MKPRLRPNHAYLHRGTRAGARALGLDSRQDKLLVKCLPPVLRRLSPEEVEDFLCRYKNHLANVGIGPVAQHQSRRSLPSF
jgi:hypothetical protein